MSADVSSSVFFSNVNALNNESLSVRLVLVGMHFLAIRRYHLRLLEATFRYSFEIRKSTIFYYIVIRTYSLCCVKLHALQLFRLVEIHAFLNQACRQMSVIF